MEDIRDILRIPNREVVSVTKVLTGVDLKKTDSNQCAKEKVLTVMIHTRGFFLANIKCEMDRDMFEQIISGMYGGGMPPDEEQSLYMNILGSTILILGEMSRRIILCLRIAMDVAFYVLLFSLNFNRMEEKIYEYNNYGG